MTEQASKTAEAQLRERDDRVRQKLENILSSQDDIGTLELSDMIDVKAIQIMMESFYKLAGIPMAMLDLKGKVFVGVGWQDACTKFHRINPETCKFCTESDTELTLNVAPGEFRLYKCKNGMVDASTPIILGGQHVGNIFIGQFFLKEEPPDYEFFSRQAQRYGFDEHEYLAAIESVPRLSREQVDTAMSFFMKLAETLSKLTFSNLKLARAIAQGDELVVSLKQSQEDLNRAQAVAHIGSWRLDVRQNVLSWSDENHRIFGISKGIPLTYQTFLSTVHPDDRQYVERHWNAALHGELYDIEHRIVVGGMVKWVRERAQLEFDEQGDLKGGFGTTQDVTELKAAEIALKQSEESLKRNQDQLLVAKSALETQNKELESIISFVSHDLRTPLVNIKGFSSELKRDCATAYKLLENVELPHEHKSTLTKIFEKYVPESLNFIQTSAEFMNNIVTSLVQVARAGIAAVNPETLDMNAIVETVIKMLETKIKQSSSQVIVEELPCCIGDKIQITQAITNLIDNAIKYRVPSHGANIRIRGTVSGQQSIYCVEDNGIGIDPRHHGEIFDMFFRLHDKVVGGEGIGLCMVKRMVDRNGGRIWVESQEGAGSRFYIALPSCQQQ